MKLFKKTAILFATLAMSFVALTGCTTTTSSSSSSSVSSSTSTGPTAQEIVDSAKSLTYVSGLNQVEGNFQLPKVVIKDSIEISVTWAANVEDVTIQSFNASYWKALVERPDFGDPNLAFTLTATLTYQSATASKSYDGFIMARATEVIPTRYTTIASIYADIAASTLKKGDTIEIIGVVNAIYAGYYHITDGTNSFAIYAESAGLKLGDELSVTGALDQYYSLWQIKKAGIIVETLSEGNEYVMPDGGVKTVSEINAMNPATTPAISGKKYTVTGIVKLVTTYENIGIYDMNASSFITIYYGSLSEDDTLAYKALAGKKVTLDLVYYTKHTSNGVLLSNFEVVSEIVGSTLTNAEAATYDRGILNIAMATTYDEIVADVDLPATGELGSTITWHSGNTEAIEDDGTVHLSADPVDVVMTAVITKPGFIIIAKYTVTVKLPTFTPATTIYADFAANTNADKTYYVSGIVVAQNSSGISYIKDDSGVIAVKNSTLGLAIGDEVIVGGKQSASYGFYLLGSSNLISKVSTGNAVDIGYPSYYATTAELNNVIQNVTNVAGVATADDFEAAILPIEKSPIAVKGYVRLNGDFTNLYSNIGSTEFLDEVRLDKVLTGLNLASFLDQEVVIEGYYSGNSASFSGSNVTVTDKVMKIVVESITLASEYVLPEPPEEPAGPTDLFFSEYIEGGSYNKAVEIFNGTGASIDLSTYSVELYSNGGTVVTTTQLLSGTLASGDVYVIAYVSGANTANAAILAVADLQATVTNWNGDDSFVLKHDGVIIDSFGQIGFDPGTSWAVAGVSTIDMTLVRKTGTLVGDTNATDIFDPSAQWVAYPKDTTTYLGSHTN